MTEITYTDAIRQVMNDVIDPVYVLAGGDPFFEDFFIDEAGKRYLPAEGNRVIYSLDDDSADTVLAELNAYSLFEGRQMIVAVGRVHKERVGLDVPLACPATFQCAHHAHAPGRGR